MERSRSAYYFQVVNRPLDASLPINEAPDRLWNDAYAHGNILAVEDNQSGWTTSPIPYEGEPDKKWRIIFPINQNVREDSTATHFMLSAWDQHFLTLGDMTIADLQPAAEVVKRFLSHEGAVAGYNISLDNRERKPHSQSWANFHFHCMTLPETMTKLPNPPRALREPGFSHIDNTLHRFFAQGEAPQGVSLLSPDALSTNTLAPFGGVVWQLPHDLPARDLAGFMKSRQTEYERLHEALFSTFVSNYPEVKASAWSIQYSLHDREERQRLLTTAPFQDETREFLHIVGEHLKDEEVTPERRLLMSPSYSAAFYRHEGSIYYSFAPHFLRKAGWLEALGIQLNRQQGDVPYTNRRLRAEAMINSMLHTE